MNTENRPHYTWVPLLMAFMLMLGVLIGSNFTTRQSADHDRKLNNILGLVENEYVDKMDIDSLIELSIPDILANLDPHSAYLSAKDLQAATEELEGSFCGVGVSFQVMDDTVNVVEVVPGGPSEKVGIATGDKIITVDGETFVGAKVNPDKVKEKLRGKKGSVVKIGIKRRTSSKTLIFSVTRDDIPVNSVDAYYLIDKNTGYVKVNQFGKNTYLEFAIALSSLRNDGAKRFIVDLRGNTGGYMEMAILMANEFLPPNRLIVTTKGRYKRDDSEVWSDGTGGYREEELVVLIDEFSASASEIFAGAIQDNDRGLVIGNRSFGKGLVQKQFDMPDKSAIRLTIARYYTPSGRCIQKDYSHGTSEYELELVNRYRNGEIYNQDSIKYDKKQVFTTVNGRTVYGGGGIIPDIFVPKDTTGVSSYYIQVTNASLLQQFVLRYVENNYKKFNSVKDHKQLLRMLSDNNSLLNQFVDYAAAHGVPPRWYYINQSRDLLLNDLKALIARNVLGQEAFYPIYNRHDKTIEAAIKALNKHKAAFPITND